MLKIPKGLKKKKKGKKGKHKGDEDLFTPEELEEYKRQKALKEQQEQQEHHAAGEEEEQAEEVAGASDHSGAASAAGGAGASGAAGPAKDPEDEDRFQALLGGVDSILNKTQRDLDRIKSTSFFQRKPTPSELESKRAEGPPARPQAPTAAATAAAAATASRKGKKWVGFEGDADSESEDEHAEHAEPQQAVNEAPAEHAEHNEYAFGHEEEEEEETEEEDNADDIFDTSYIDVITSGEVKLAYIPDSPVEEQADGDDPFDTTYAAKVIGNDEDIKKRQKLEKVSLGIAVDVLTGKAAPPSKPPPLPENAVAKRAVPRRVKPVDLLKLGSFDEGSAPPASSEDAESEAKADAPKSLLDDDALLAIPEDLPPVGTPIIPPAASIVPAAAPEKEEAKEDEEKQIDLSEFDVIAEKPVVSLPVSNLALVAAALGGPAPPQEEEEDEELEDEFAALAQESIQKQKEDEDEFAIDGEDPFDTSAAAVLLGDTAKPQEPAKAAVNVDVLLSGPPANWSAFDDDDHPHPQLKPSRPPPPRPAAPAQQAVAHEDEDVDPFDTSFAQNILPGKTELKLIEKEILGKSPSERNEARILSNSDSDFDFNPREGEQAVSSVSIHVTDPAGLIDNSPVVHRDLLGGSTSDLSQLGHDPIEPADLPADLDEDTQLHEDPFDTSAVEAVAAPGRTELRYLEKEILGDVNTAPQAPPADDDFDPRAEETRRKASRPDVLGVQPHKSVNFALPSPSVRPDLLAAGAEEGTKFTKPLTPYYADQAPPLTEDPFDTTHVTNLAPGKTELRILESELVDDTYQTSIRTSLSDDEFDPRGLKDQPSQPANQDLFNVEDGEGVGHRPLTPAVEEAVDIDPFDTSIASNIAPGKAELKVLEKELISGDPQPSIKRTYTDPDFNPRDGPDQDATKDLLNETSEAVQGAKPLTPVLGEQTSLEKDLEDDIDPFDTSIAADLGPGKTELRILESELIGRQ